MFLHIWHRFVYQSWGFTHYRFNRFCIIAEKYHGKQVRHKTQNTEYEFSKLPFPLYLRLLNVRKVIYYHLSTLPRVYYKRVVWNTRREAPIPIWVTAPNNRLETESTVFN